jgi:hypothetical protein
MGYYIQYITYLLVSYRRRERSAAVALLESIVRADTDITGYGSRTTRWAWRLVPWLCVPDRFFRQIGNAADRALKWSLPSLEIGLREGEFVRVITAIIRLDPRGQWSDPGILGGRGPWSCA